MLIPVCGGAVAVADDGLGAVTRCAGHELGTFSDVSACVNENGALHICENNFPDAIFRNYVCRLPGADDGYLSDQECKSVTEIIIDHSMVSSLQGIEFFTALIHLSCRDNRLTTLNVSYSKELMDLDCSDNQLTVIDVSHNTNLTGLNCGSKQLTKLNVRENTRLESLHIYFNEIAEIDIKSNTALQHLDANNNQLTELDVKKVPQLRCLSCYNNQLTQLDVGDNPNLEELICSGNQLTELDVSRNPSLRILYCFYNHLKSLDLRANGQLTEAYCNTQSNPLNAVYKNRRWEVDLGAFVPPQEFDRILVDEIGTFDPNTGIVTFAEKPAYFAYYYDTGNPVNEYLITVLENEHVFSEWTITQEAICTEDGSKSHYCLQCVYEEIVPIYSNGHTYTNEGICMNCGFARICRININGKIVQHTVGQERSLTADSFYLSQGWGYRFAGWRGDIDTIADPASSDTTVRIPARDITLQAEYILIGDIDGNGDITPADAVQIARMSVQNIPERSAGDIDGDGIVTSADVVYMKRYLVGNFTPTK